MKLKNIGLIPNAQNPTPDYYCTWQTQLYATCDGKPEGQRRAICESSLFDKEKPFGWAYFYPEVRSDLFFVMDDSWDVPPSNDESYYGSLVLDREKFPEAAKAGSNGQALKSLTDRVKALGWKGLGGWVCVQESDKRGSFETEDDYWIDCLRDADEAGFAYWKVDWGHKSKDPEFRQKMTELGRVHAPELIIEHAQVSDKVASYDVFRTYDVPAIFSIPKTMEKLKGVLFVGVTKPGYKGLINCEDEAYIAAAGGFSMGIMRHPYSGSFVNGKSDMSFPSVHRNLKTKMYEVTRAARWHRVAPAFGVDSENTKVSDTMLEDTWQFEDYSAEIESWWVEFSLLGDRYVNDHVTLPAPAMIVRNCDFPIVEPDEKGNVPYVVASKNPNGVYSIVTCGRTFERSYGIPACRVSIDVGDTETVGVFGEYNELVINTDYTDIKGVLAQDIAAEFAIDITEDVRIEKGKVTIPGELLHRIGTSAQPPSDTSEPGTAIKICR